MNRRDFLQSSLSTAVVALVAPQLLTYNRSVSAESKANPIDTLRSRLLFLEGISNDRSPEILKLVADRDEWIANTLRDQFLKPGAASYGSFWGDKGELTIAKYSGLWYMEVHANLARGWADPRSRYYKSAQLIQAIETSLRWLAPVLRTDPKKRTGFYYWDIYNHEQAARTLVLCGEGISAEGRKTLTDFLTTLPSQVFQVSREKGVLKPLESGSNMLDVLFALLLRGVALNDEQWIKVAVAQLPIAMGKDPGGEGIQIDWSYHYHGRGINLGYGMNDLAMRARWFFLTHDTPWQIGQDLQAEYLGLISEFFRHNFWKGRVSPYVIDRGIAAPDGIFAGYKMFDTLALSLLAGFDPKEHAMLVATAQNVLPKPKPDLFQATLQKQITSQINNSNPHYTTIRFYPESDYMIARQRDWVAFIRMASLRTKAWDAQNRQHIKGSSSGEFSIALMTDAKEFDNTTAPTMKWNRLMNVTRCDAIEAPPMSYGQSTFVGGLSEENELGVCAMQYLLAPPGQDALTGNKSTFATRDALVLLGNRIRCNGNEPVMTTLFHASMEEGATYLRNGQKLDISGDAKIDLRAGEVLLLRNVAIQLLHPATLFLEMREGNYAALNDAEYSGSKSEAFQKVYRRRWIYLETHHGAKPESGVYGAILWPSVAPNFSPPKLQIIQTNSHHRLDLNNGRGTEVRFPTDWREKSGLSYSGAEPFKWGSLAQWRPGADNDHFELQILAPRRYAAVPSSATELVLPAGFAMDHGPLAAMTGKPFPDHLLATSADGKVKTMTVRKTK